MNEGDVRHDRHLPAERLIDLSLAGAIVEVIVTADDVGDAHIVVVDNDGEHVSGRAVRTQQDEVIEIFVLPNDASLNLIVDDSFSSERCLEPDDRIYSGGHVIRITLAAAAAIEARAAFRPGLLAHRGEFVRSAIASVGMTCGEKLLGHLAVARRARELEDDLTVPGQAKPGQPVDNGVDGGSG